MTLDNDYHTLKFSVGRILNVLATNDLHKMTTEDRDRALEIDRDRILELFSGFLSCCGDTSARTLVEDIRKRK